MKKNDRTEFATGQENKIEFNQLVKPPKKTVNIDGENNFGNDALSQVKPVSTKKTEVKRGRPKVITDERYTVCKPKKISPALEVKLKVLEDYMIEFREITGRITFEMMVDALADSYMNQRLPMGKSEKALQDIEVEMEKLKIKKV